MSEAINFGDGTSRVMGGVREEVSVRPFGGSPSQQLSRLSVPSVGQQPMPAVTPRPSALPPEDMMPDWHEAQKQAQANGAATEADGRRGRVDELVARVENLTMAVEILAKGLMARDLLAASEMGMPLEEYQLQIGKATDALFPPPPAPPEPVTTESLAAAVADIEARTTRKLEGLEGLLMNIASQLGIQGSNETPTPQSPAADLNTGVEEDPEVTVLPAAGVPKVTGEKK